MLTPAQRDLLARITAAGSLVVTRHHPGCDTDATEQYSTISALQRRGLITAKRLGRGRFQLEARKAGAS